MNVVLKINHKVARKTVFLLLRLTVIVTALISSYPVSAFHCYAGQPDCPKLYPDPPAHADQGEYSICDWPDGVHPRCGPGGYSDPPDHECTAEGSIISIEDQRVGEDVNIVETPFQLHYETDRVPGRFGAIYDQTFDARVLGLGGWTVNVNHAYPHWGQNLSSQKLYLGNGRRRAAEALGTVFKAANDTNHFKAGERVIASEDDDDFYVFDDKGKHLRTLNAITGNIIYQFAYDNANRLTTITDGNGNVTIVERDPHGAPVAIVSPFGQRTALTVNSDGYLTKITNPAGKSYLAEYTKDGLLTSFADPQGNVRHYAYDSVGRLSQATDPLGATKKLIRTNKYNGYTLSFSDADGRTTNFTIENDLIKQNDQTQVHSMTQKIISPDGLETESVDYPINSRLVSTFADGVKQERITLRDPQWGLQKFLPQNQTIRLPSGLASDIGFDRHVQLADAADPLSLVSQTDTWTVNDKTAKSTYDATTHTFSNVSPAGRSASTTIDEKGLITKIQIPGIYLTDSVYDSRGRLASISQGPASAPRTVQIGYGADGFAANLINPLGQKTTLTRNTEGQITQVTFPDGRITSFAYDANGNVTEIEPPGRPSHKFTYSGVDLPMSYTAPQVGAEPNQTRYVYNLSRQLTQITRPDDKTLILEYDSAGRLSTVKNDRGTLAFTYDARTGNISSINAPDGVGLAYRYDGSLLTDVNINGPVTGKVSYTYNSDFLLTGLSVNGQNSISFQYDADRLLAKAGNLTMTRSTQNGLLTGTALGSLTDSYSYDGFAEVTAYEAKYGTTSLLRFEYAYDKLGRITQKKEIRGGTTTHVYNYGYDTAGRLVEVKQDGITTASYGYDANGNRTQLNGATVAHYDDQDRLLDYQSAVYQYTANGELQQKTVASQTTQYDYDVIGNLRKVTLPGGTIIDYLIDGQNRRIGKKVNGTLVQAFLYQGQLQPIAELDGSGNILSRFVYATGVNVPDYLVKGGVTYRIVKDHLGSPRLVVDVATNTVAQELDYDAFGNVTLDTNPGFQPFGFAGGLYDRDTRLVRFGVRDYEAEAGRWTAKDPISFAGGDINLFGYVLENSVNQIDPKGLYTEVIIWQPVGHGSSSFGHVSTNINGLNYSWGPGGWDKQHNFTTEYIERQNEFRSGIGIVLDLTPEQEDRLARCLAHPRGEYSILGNNCGTPPEMCLQYVLGSPVSSSILPVNILKDLLQSPYAIAETSYLGPGTWIP